MGLFDTIHCEHPLPDPAHQDLEYQTKDLVCELGEFTITADGRLVKHPSRGLFADGTAEDVEWPVHGDLRMYDSLESDDGSREWVEYVVRFTHGRVESIRRVADPQERPTVPPVLEKPWLRARPRPFRPSCLRGLSPGAFRRRRTWRTRPRSWSSWTGTCPARSRCCCSC